MKTRLTLISIWAACALTAPAQASCAPSTKRERVQRADAVFVGRVLSVRSGDARTRFRVLHVRKARRRIHKGGAVRVYPEHYPSSVTIDYKPRRGERWRVYAQRRRGRWITSDCLGTRRV